MGRQLDIEKGDTVLLGANRHGYTSATLPLGDPPPPTCRRVFKLDIAWGCEVQQGIGDQPIEALVGINCSHSNECGTRGGPLQDPLCVVGDPKGLELGRVVIDIQDVDRELGWGTGGSEYQGQSCVLP